jgi:uncharacterized protein YbjT (DUF2867 family)
MSTPESQKPGPVLLTGATGYIGGRLLLLLERSGRPVRCLARNPEFLSSRVEDGTEVRRGDVFDPESLRTALDGVDQAFYLVHSMSGHDTFEARDREAATNFGRAAREAGVRRIVYLGGLGQGDNLSGHLRSRQEVGRILANSGVPTIELRASIVIGSGSLSFEMIRALVERLPIMLTPRWTRSRAQPIAVEDVLSYLLACLDLPLENGSTVYEIGGADEVSYTDLMREFAKQRGLKRWILPVPVLTPRLSSLWLGLVTPLFARVGRALLEGVVNDTVVTDGRALVDFPIRPRSCAEAIARALVNEDREFAETRWFDAVCSSSEEEVYGGVRFGSRLVDTRVTRVPVSAEQAFAAVRRIGGQNGWYYGDGLWRLRGAFDLLVGGVGMRRGRRDPEHLEPGDTLDCWRVEAVTENRLLRLRAEMKLPGRAWLQFEIEEDGEGAKIRQTALFDPLGLPGLAYWYGIYTLHQFVFAGMLAGVRKAALRGEAPISRA